MNKQPLIWILFGLILFLVGWQRWHLRNVPLERDEGEYVYQGQLILQGVVPFQVAYSSQKFPGIYLVAALSQVLFGAPPVGIHLGLLVVNLLSMGVLFLLVRRWVGEGGALLTALVQGLLSVSPSVLGFAAHATHFVALPMLAGFYFLELAITRKRWGDYFWSGLCFGVAVTMRQPAVFFGIFAFGWIAWQGWRTGDAWKTVLGRFLVYGLGSILPTALLVLWLWRAGVWDRFVFWTFTYAASYGSLMTPEMGWACFQAAMPGVIGDNWPLWLLAGAGLGLLVWKRPPFWGMVVGWGFAGFLAIASGFYFRQHYFIQGLPWLASLVGVLAGAGHWAFPSKGKKISVWPLVGPVLVGGGCGITFLLQTPLLVEAKPDQFSRQVYGLNPFPEALVVADYIKRNSRPDQTVAVLGSEPEIYAYAERRAATGYYITYPLTEPTTLAHGMQEEMIREIEQNQPEFMIVVNVPTSWLVRPNSERRIFEWAEGYLKNNYKLDGLADLTDQETTYAWGRETSSHVSRGACSVLVFRRK